MPTTKNFTKNIYNLIKKHYSKSATLVSENQIDFEINKTPVTFWFKTEPARTDSDWYDRLVVGNPMFEEPERFFDKTEETYVIGQYGFLYPKEDDDVAEIIEDIYSTIDFEIESLTKNYDDHVEIYFEQVDDEPGVFYA